MFALFGDSWNWRLSKETARQVALEREVAVEDAQQKQFLDLEGATDDEFDDEEIFEDEAALKGEQGRRSLASLFGSEEEDYVEVDAALQDTSLLVWTLPVCLNRARHDL